MTKEQYDEALKEISDRYRQEVLDLQERYKKEYKLFKAGDLCREQRGFKSYFVVKAVRHVANQGDLYTLLDGITTNKNGEEHYGSRKDTFRDTESKLIRPS